MITANGLSIVAMMGMASASLAFWCQSGHAAQPEGGKPAKGAEPLDRESPLDPLRVTVGEPTVMAPAPGHTQGILAVSRTGAVAAFYECMADGHKIHPGGARVYIYKVSRDGGRTWGPEMLSRPEVAEGAMFTALRGGGVLKMSGQATPSKEGGKGGLEVTRVLFSDDFQHYEIEKARVSLPGAVMHTKWAKFYPVFDKGKMVQLSNGDLLATMYGNLKGDTRYRTLLVQSSDSGRSWEYHATVAYGPNDPHPELVGEYCGYCEPSLAQLPDGKLLCMMRTQGTHIPPNYRPMYSSWSGDVGKTWTKPTPTRPHLKNVWPTLAVLDNGVVACIYGRPGVHVVFSTDQGHTWGHRVTFTELNTAPPTGEVGISAYGDLVKVGPNKLLAIAAVGPGGTRVFPITVDRQGAKATTRGAR